MKNIVIAWIVFVALWPALVSAATINAASCNLADVSSAISSASAGDVIQVPAGSCTWSTQLVLSKGVALKGAGIGNTIITLSNSGDYSIVIHPANYAANEPYRISGFTFDFSGGGGAIWLNNQPSLIPQSKVRIDHNRFYNTKGQAMVVSGMRGLVDNNIFDKITYPVRMYGGYGNEGQQWWDSDSWGLVQFGSDKNIYFEDNIFNDEDDKGGGPDAQSGNRYAYRYNTFTIVSDTYNFFDWHGNQGSGYMYAAMGGEIYGNLFNAGSYESKLLDDRGGKGVVFYNKYASTGWFSFQVREEYDDALNPTVHQPQHVTDTYYWNNRNSKGDLNSITAEQKVGDIPKMDRDFFIDASPFTGASGVGCGTLAARPTTCTLGVGYWATDQSCTSLTGLVGAHPATPISGTFYKCIATDTWTAYFTPLAYPHPFRTDCVNYPMLCDSGSAPPPPLTQVPGDINGDGKVDLSDLIIVSGDFGKTSGFNNPKSDTNSDNVVDIFDIVFVASRFT